MTPAWRVDCSPRSWPRHCIGKADKRHDLSLHLQKSPLWTVDYVDPFNPSQPTVPPLQSTPCGMVRFTAYRYACLQTQSAAEPKSRRMLLDQTTHDLSRWLVVTPRATHVQVANHGAGPLHHYYSC